MTHVVELRRRFLNMDFYYSMEDRRTVVEDFLQKMRDSGFDYGTRMEVVKSVSKKYYIKVMDPGAGGKRLCRRKNSTESSNR